MVYSCVCACSCAGVCVFDGGVGEKKTNERLYRFRDDPIGRWRHIWKWRRLVFSFSIGPRSPPPLRCAPDLSVVVVAAVVAVVVVVVVGRSAGRERCQRHLAVATATNPRRIFMAGDWPAAASDVIFSQSGFGSSTSWFILCC